MNLLRIYLTITLCLSLVSSSLMGAQVGTKASSLARAGMKTARQLRAQARPKAEPQLINVVKSETPPISDSSAQFYRNLFKYEPELSPKTRPITPFYKNVPKFEANAAAGLGFLAVGSAVTALKASKGQEEEDLSMNKNVLSPTVIKEFEKFGPDAVIITNLFNKFMNLLDTKAEKHVAATKWGKLKNTLQKQVDNGTITDPLIYRTKVIVNDGLEALNMLKDAQKFQALYAQHVDLEKSKPIYVTLPDGRKVTHISEAQKGYIDARYVEYQAKRTLEQFAHVLNEVTNVKKYKAEELTKDDIEKAAKIISRQKKITQNIWAIQSYIFDRAKNIDNEIVRDALWVPFTYIPPVDKAFVEGLYQPAAKGYIERGKEELAKAYSSLPSMPNMPSRQEVREAAAKQVESLQKKLGY